jgi:hypothetical protein
MRADRCAKHVALDARGHELSLPLHDPDLLTDARTNLEMQDDAARGVTRIAPFAGGIVPITQRRRRDIWKPRRAGKVSPVAHAILGWTSPNNRVIEPYDRHRGREGVCTAVDGERSQNRWLTKSLIARARALGIEGARRTRQAKPTVEHGDPEGTDVPERSCHSMESTPGGLNNSHRCDSNDGRVGAALNTKR